MQTLQNTLDAPNNPVIERAKTEVLKTVAYALLRQAYGVGEPQRPNVYEQQVDFFAEVRRFEINLIRQALLYASGNKAGAARLLNLNATTLHSKLKIYSLDGTNDGSDKEVAPPTARFHDVSASGPFTNQDYIDGDGTFHGTISGVKLETIKTEVLKSIARVLEFKANNISAVVEFDGERGVNFYDEVMKFEIELIGQAISRANGNQRAAARMLNLKTTTLYSKVKLYKLNIEFIAA